MTRSNTGPRSDATTESESDLKRLEEFAISIVRTLKEWNYIAYFAGGCVRDQIMGIAPSDYDVATSATPAQVQQIFGRHRSLMIGASFGVVAVHDHLTTSEGKKKNFHVEVATFRSDGAYIDGRHPCEVVFTSPEHDAQRRDFTINALFRDPIEEKIIDFVEGRTDIERRIINAIGDPAARFYEDRLRLLRCVRFASRFDFSIEANTLRSAIELAPQIHSVSGERIANEMRKMLSFPPGRVRAFALLRTSGLLRELLPEFLLHIDNEHFSESLASVTSSEWTAAMASATLELINDSAQRISFVDRIKGSWKLSNEESAELKYLVETVPILFSADSSPWSRVQPLLTHRSAPIALATAYDMCSQKHPKTARELTRLIQLRSSDESHWNPPMIVDGQFLQGHGVTPGPIYADAIRKARAEQLDGRLRSKNDADKWINNYLNRNT